MSTQQDTITLGLPEHLDRSGVAQLKSELDAHLDHPLILDGSENSSVSGLGLQLLHFAKHKWQSEGLAFEITNPSETLSKSMDWMDSETTGQIGDAEACL